MSEAAQPAGGASASAAGDATVDRTVRLPDGRKLGYRIFGDPDGAPVLFFHGTPLTRLNGLWWDAGARRVGVRLIAVDRPGLGLSDPQPGRTLLDWADDVSAFADSLGLGDFGVLGYSGGSPHAAACAWALSERLTGVSIAAGFGPLRQERAHLRPDDRRLGFMARRLPAFTTVMFGLVARRMRRDPQWAVRMITKDFSSRDLDFVERTYGHLSAAERTAGMLETYRQGPAGVVDDYRVLHSAWGFAPEDITAPVYYWHGGQDRIVPPPLARAIADRVPGATLHAWPEEGHVSVADYAEDMLGPLLAG